MKDCEVIEKCLLCGSPADIFYNLGKTPLANEFSEYKDYIEDDTFDLTLMKCSKCNHIQLDTIVNQDRLYRDYLYVSSTSAVNRKHFEKYANNVIEKFKLKKEDQILEIGSNDGLFLSFFKEKGFSNILGVDPAKNLAFAATMSGIPTVPTFFSLELAIGLANKTATIDGSSWKFNYEAKICIANHIFAHNKDLKTIVQGILEILADDGVFIFENSYLIDVLDKCLLGTIYSEHCHTHAITPMIKFLRSLGMKVFDVQRLPEQQGGSFRVFCCKNSAKYKVEQSVFDLLELEKQLPQKLEQFKSKINTWKQETWKLLKKYKSEGKTIDIFGYPAKLTTELYTLGVGKDTFRYAYEDAELKIGKFSPGLHIPILHPDELMKNNPDVLFVGAWNFAESVVEKCKMLGFKGKFVIPFPELKVI